MCGEGYAGSPYFNILNLAIDEACKLLGNPEWSTRTDY